MSTAPSFSLSRDPFGRLVLLDRWGIQHDDVHVVRAFPLSDPAHWIAIVNASGAELMLLDSLESLPHAVRGVILEEFAESEFIAEISRIHRVSTDRQSPEWHVDTDRGPKTFRLASDDGLRRLGAYRALIVDDAGVRYSIADTRRLDSTSRAILERYL